MTTNQAYIELLKPLCEVVEEVAPRQQYTKEIVGHVTEIDMRSPIITLPGRGLDYQFMAAEAHWILRGSRYLDHTTLVRNLLKYSDDGITMRGAYGPPFIQQVEYVVETLKSDSESRQAVMTLWERSPRKSADIPCTVSIQFLLRGGTIHTNVFMRSSDAWLGWPYDIFTFTMMTHYIRLILNYSLSMGTLRLLAGSQHIYMRKFDDARKLVDAGVSGNNLIIDNTKLTHLDQLFIALGHIRNCPNLIAFLELQRLLCQ